MNCAAPDDGTMHLLSVMGSTKQRERYFRLLIQGTVRSCFAVSEPPPGAGSDQRALASIARRVPGGWLLKGNKQFITGAGGVHFAIVMARSSDEGAWFGTTVYLVDTEKPDWQLGERIRTIDSVTVGGHCRVRMRGLFVADDAVLGEAGRGIADAQVRLGAARLTHCMRWLGAARRAPDLALQYAHDRTMAGVMLGSLGMAQLIADKELALEVCRALLREAPAHHTQGGRGTRQSSRAKVFISEATCRVVADDELSVEAVELVTHLAGEASRWAAHTYGTRQTESRGLTSAGQKRPRGTADVSEHPNDQERSNLIYPACARA